jgi:hypothetical protein
MKHGSRFYYYFGTLLLILISLSKINDFDLNCIYSVVKQESISIIFLNLFIIREVTLYDLFLSLNK